MGKTVIFNALTGSHQHVANFPGCTVEHKEGKCSFAGNLITVIDLPGTYSLSSFSEDELVSREYLINDKPDLIINVIDASNLERNLFLTIQLLELNLPIVIALNMLDIAKSKGFEINVESLRTKLNVPVIPMVATKSEGLVELLNMVLEYSKREKVRNNQLFVDGLIKSYKGKIAPPRKPKITSTPSFTKHSHMIWAPVIFIVTPLFIKHSSSASQTYLLSIIPQISRFYFGLELS